MASPAEDYIGYEKNITFLTVADVRFPPESGHGLSASVPMCEITPVL
jgi:hypothetical protein